MGYWPVFRSGPSGPASFLGPAGGYVLDLIDSGVPGGGGPPPPWIMAAGAWNDSGLWDDTATWSDA